MYAQQLIGKLALRTKPTSYGDYSYSSEPIRIMAVTESHVVYQHHGVHRRHLGEENSVLDNRWNDNNWTSYDDLMNLATEEHIELLNKVSQ